jgi:hypothetical protein
MEVVINLSDQQIDKIVTEELKAVYTSCEEDAVQLACSVLAKFYGCPPNYLNGGEA